MKHNKYCISTVYVLFISCLTLLSCQKVDIKADSYQANLSVINAIPDTELKCSFSATVPEYSIISGQNYYFYDDIYNSGIARTFGLPTHNLTPFVVALSTDTLKPIFSEIIPAQVGDTYSLFFSGTKSSVDVMLFKDDIPIVKDSSTNVRFVNLSSTAESISINLVGHDVGSEVATLDYKEITSFKSYAAPSVNTEYLFEVRSVATGSVLATYAYNAAMFKSVTLVVRGVLNGAPALEVARANNY